VNYLLWAEGSQNQGQHQPLPREDDTPWSITGTPVLLSRPEFDWEQVRYWVNEGPAVIKHQGHIFITYSAAGTGAEYCLGCSTPATMPTCSTRPRGRNRPQPVFITSEHNGVFGPGHNCFTTDGKTDILVYHARDYRDIKGDPLHDPNRHTRAQAIHWNGNGTPDFGVPARTTPEPADGPSAVVPSPGRNSPHPIPPTPTRNACSPSP